MRKNQPIYARKLRQFQSLSKRVDRAMASGDFQAIPAAGRQRIMARLRHLYQQLRRRYAVQRLQRIMAGAALLLGFSHAANAQVNFTGPTTNPFDYTPVSSYYVQPEAVDIDGDGDLDIFQGDDYGFYTYYENTGSATAAAFAAGQATGFGADSVPGYYAFLAFADLDADGDYDMLVGEYYAGIVYYENTGSATAPNFPTAYSDTLGLPNVPDRHISELVDLDGDGDYDLLVSGYSSAFYYLENVGDSANASFAAEVTNPFGLAAPSYYGMSAFADLDMDGDLDILYSSYDNEFRYQENTGTATAPAFGPVQVNPFGFTTSLGFPQPVFADFDGDGDMDFFHSESTCSIQYYENAAAVNVEDALLGTGLQAAPNPAENRTVLRLENGNLAEEVLLEVYSIEGKQVLREMAGTIQGRLEKTIYLDSFAPGIYTVRISSGEQIFHTRFSKQ